MNKKNIRLRRCRKSRFLYKKSNKFRLVVHKTSCHIYAQIICFKQNNSYVLVYASTLEKISIFKDGITGNKIAAKKIGRIIAERSINRGIYNVVFDRSGFKYHGRIKILADSARKYGLLF